MNPGTSTIYTKRVVFLISLVVVLSCTYVLVSSIISIRTTGVLRALSSDNATISVSQPGKGAEFIGYNRAGVRLAPGRYQVVASNGSALVNYVVYVNRGKTTRVYLDLAKSQQLPSVQNINFVGFDVFLDHGVTSSVISSLKQNFFQFSKRSKIITVTNVKPIPHNPNSLSVFDTINFDARVDQKNYKSRLDYSALTDSSRLILSRVSDGKLVFDSGAAD